jgi:hypothetical protein
MVHDEELQNKTGKKVVWQHPGMLLDDTCKPCCIAPCAVVLAAAVLCMYLRLLVLWLAQVRSQPWR